MSGKADGPPSPEEVTIAHILPWTGVGGTEHATLRLAAAARPFRSVFFCPQESVEVARFFREAGGETTLYPLVEPSPRNPFPYLRASWRLASRFRKHRIRILHCSDWVAVQYVALAAKLAGCRLISHVRNRHERIPRRDWRVLRLVDRFIFVSRQTAEAFGYPVPEGRSTVLYDGIGPAPPPASPEEIRALFGFPANARVIGTAARVAEQKDFPTLIRAAAEIAKGFPDVRFLVLGDHERLPEHRTHFRLVRDCLAQANVDPLFRFAGFREDAVRLLGGLEIFVLSTHWEGLPLVILEAMSQGLPVVATRVDGVVEAVEEGVTGYLVPHQDAPGLAAALGILLGDPEGARRMGEAGRRRVGEQFGLERFGRHLGELYQSLLG